MDTTIRNLDAALYRAMKARAAGSGRTIGEVMNEAIRAWLAQPGATDKTMSFFDFSPVDLGDGSEHLSEEVDGIVYGI